jgi:hypothetical protein
MQSLSVSSGEACRPCTIDDTMTDGQSSLDLPGTSTYSTPSTPGHSSRSSLPLSTSPPQLHSSTSHQPVLLSVFHSMREPPRYSVLRISKTCLLSLVPMLEHEVSYPTLSHGDEKLTKQVPTGCLRSVISLLSPTRSIPPLPRSSPEKSLMELSPQVTRMRLWRSCKRRRVESTVFYR